MMEIKSHKHRALCPYRLLFHVGELREHPSVEQPVHLSDYFNNEHYSNGYPSTTITKSVCGRDSLYNMIQYYDHIGSCPYTEKCVSLRPNTLPMKLRILHMRH